MANWDGIGRTNWFPIRDDIDVKAALAKFPIDIRIEQRDGVEMCAMFGDEGDVNIERDYFDEETFGAFPAPIQELFTADLDVDMFSVAMAAAKPGTVVVYMEAGHEKLRYASGYAIAGLAGSDKPCVHIGLDDIYAEAERKFDVRASPASY